MEGVEEIRASEILAVSGDPERVRKVKRYDFKRPDKFSLEQIRTFFMIHEMIARSLTATISTGIGTAAEVKAHAVDQLTYGEFLEAVPEVSGFATVDLAPLRGPIVVQLDGSLATLLIDAACGQNPATLSLKAPTGPCTEIESLVLESVLERLLPAIRDGWRNAVELSPSIGGIETNKRDMQVVPPTEMIILASLRVTIGGGEAYLNIAFPYLTIEPIIHVLCAQYWYSTVRTRNRGVPELGGRAHDIPVACEIAIPLGEIPLSVLPTILDGQPLPLRALDRGAAELRVGSVVVSTVDLPTDAPGEARLDLAVRGPSNAGARGSRAPSAASDAADLVARIDPVLSDLRSELRALRVSIEELQQNREPSFPTEPAGDGQTWTDAGVPAVDAPSELALLVSAERPPVCAFLLAPLEPTSAARILTALPAPLRDGTVRALTTLESADLALHARVLTLLRRRIQTKRDSSVAGGPESVAEILNHVPRGVEKAVMERFMAEDRPLFESIARLMFVFEDFVLVDTVAIRKVASQVGADELALALKGVAKEVVSHILGALDDEQVAAIEEAEASLGRVRRRDVEAAQRDVIEELRRLEERGEVVVARPDEVVE